MHGVKETLTRFNFQVSVYVQAHLAKFLQTQRGPLPEIEWCVCVCVRVCMCVCVCVCVCVRALSRVPIFRSTYFQTAVLPNEGDSYIYYCTIVSPLPTLFQILSMSFRHRCVWLLQVPECAVQNLDF